MAVLLIEYEPRNLKPEADPIPPFVKQYKQHVKLSDGSYAIETEEKTSTLFRKILPKLGENAHLLIVTLVQPFTFKGPDHENEWLWKHLPEF